MDYRTKIESIKSLMKRGLITYDQAREQAQPIIDEMNEKTKAIAKEFGKKHKPFTFTYLFR